MGTMTALPVLLLKILSILIDFPCMVLPQDQCINKYIIVIKFTIMPDNTYLYLAVAGKPEIQC
jgi:hypothetical protein